MTIKVPQGPDMKFTFRRPSAAPAAPAAPAARGFRRLLPSSGGLGSLPPSFANSWRVTGGRTAGEPWAIDAELAVDRHLGQ
jgi:hypothetical protein